MVSGKAVVAFFTFVPFGLKPDFLLRVKCFSCVVGLNILTEESQTTIN